MNQEQHEMFLQMTHPSGAEEWNCPTCGRRLLISWEPKFQKTVLAAGDEFSIHSGGKGGLRIGPAQITPVNDSNAEDPRLAPWETWMDENKFEDLWDDEDE